LFQVVTFKKSRVSQKPVVFGAASPIHFVKLIYCIQSNIRLNVKSGLGVWSRVRQEKLIYYNGLGCALACVADIK